MEHGTQTKMIAHASWCWLIPVLESLTLQNNTKQTYIKTHSLHLNQFIPSEHAMIQPLQRNWCWFHEQREQRAYSAFLEFLLPCLYLHSLKVSQLEKESQEQRERCNTHNQTHFLTKNGWRRNLLRRVLHDLFVSAPEMQVRIGPCNSGFIPPDFFGSFSHPIQIHS